MQFKLIFNIINRMTNHILSLLLENFIKIKNLISMIDDRSFICLILCIKIFFNILNITTDYLFIVIENIINIKNKNLVVDELLFIYLIIK